MTIVPGSRLGPYEITAPLGEGGMGVVYSARDARLGRTVAIKLLRPEASAFPPTSSSRGTRSPPARPSSISRPPLRLSSRRAKGSARGSSASS